MAETLIPGQVSLRTLAGIYWNATDVALSETAFPGIEAAAALVRKAAEGDEAVYGVNTGFRQACLSGSKPGDTHTLQRNLILSHCCGVGEPLDRDHTR
jgi:histidine ammonia-lyase